jgi:hypothetical protein
MDKAEFARLGAAATNEILHHADAPGGSSEGLEDAQEKTPTVRPGLFFGPLVSRGMGT